MRICKEVKDYLKWCELNPDKVNYYRKLLIENIVNPTLKRKDVVFNEVLFYKAINYIEKWFYKLLPFQKFILAFVFMYVDDMPLFTQFFIEMGRGNGKDGFIVPLLNFLQTPMHGIKGYNIDIVANSEDQAKDSFNVAYDMLSENEDVFDGLFYWNRVMIVDRDTNSRMKYNTSNAKTKDGKRLGCVWFNEYHQYETAADVRVFTSSLGKIEHPRIFVSSTNGYVRGGAFDELESASIAILNGGDNLLKIFPFLCKLDDEKEVDNPATWIKANPSIEYMPVLRATILDEYNKMKVMPSMRAEFLTKRMNIPRVDEATAVTSWEKILRTSYSDVEKRIPRKTPELNGRTSILGIDFADLRDFANVGFLFKVDGEVIWRSRSWICINSPFFNEIKFPFENAGQPGFNDYVLVDKPMIDAEEVVAWAVEEMQKYAVVKIIMDSYRFRLIRSIFEKYGITSESKENPSGLVRMIRNMPSVMAIVAPIIERHFIEETFNAGDSALWRWYVNNTGLQMDGNGNKKYFKIEPKLRKNDGFMAAAVAMTEESMLDEIVIYV